MTQFQQMEYGVRLGVDYPNPIVPPFSPKPYNKGSGRGERKGGGRSGKKDVNPNRGRGQRKDMKSLKEGQFRMN